MKRNVYELRRDELQELKISWCGFHGLSLSYKDLSAIDELISDKLIFKIYDNVGFSEDDFYCNS